MLALRVEQAQWKYLFEWIYPFLNESLFCKSYFLCNYPACTYFFPKVCLHFVNVSVNLQLEAGKTSLYLCTCIYIGMELLRESHTGCWEDQSLNKIKVHTVLQLLQREMWLELVLDDVFSVWIPSVCCKDLSCLWLRSANLLIVCSPVKEVDLLPQELKSTAKPLWLQRWHSPALCEREEPPY